MGSALSGCHEGCARWTSKEDPQQFNSEGYRKEDGALLAGAHPNAFPQVDIPKGIGTATPKFSGGFDAFVAATPAVKDQASNLIKKCPQCGKPCAITMTNCNACNASLTEVETTKSPNLFVGFVFGVDKAGFPLKISLRAEEPGLMVFDDPLAITRAHILAVPTDTYCPDIRSLFTAPNQGLALLQRMDNAAWVVLRDGPLADKAWRQKALSAAGNKMSVDALRPHVIGAFNLPPSQYQLHLQYMLPPLLPQHVGVYKKGAHFMKMRHFPFAYVVEALKAFDAAGKTIPGVTEMTAPQLVKAVEELGVNYEKAWKADMAKLDKSNLLLANYDPADFDYAIVDGQVIDKNKPAVPAAQRVPAEGAPSAKDVDGADKMALQGYGRPYTDGKPGGVYYSHARAPSALPVLSML